MISGKTIFQIDSFTDEPFKGNPAGVMILGYEMDKDLMQNIASEMNLSETAFIFPKKEYFEIRYFTPTKEVQLCGHATLASAHILYEQGLVKPTDRIFFKAAGGDLFITKDSDWLVMNFPKYTLNQITLPKSFSDIIGFEPVEAYSSDYDWKIAVAATEAEILNAIPNFEKMMENGFGHLMITSASKREDIDFVVRCFAPISGINEDPVTGSAHCALTPLWCLKTGKSEMNSLQVSKRTGKLKVKLNNNRVEIKGKAVTIFEANLKILNSRN
jgi:PhzF family phenazine biosynthesis protein